MGRSKVLPYVKWTSGFGSCSNEVCGHSSWSIKPQASCDTKAARRVLEVRWPCFHRSIFRGGGVAHVGRQKQEGWSYLACGDLLYIVLYLYLRVLDRPVIPISAQT